MTAVPDDGTPVPPPDDESAPRPPRRVRLPGFVVDEDIGLGEAVARATSAVGIRPCGGCRRRAARLDGWVTFTRRG